MAIDILTALRTVTTNIKEYVDDKVQNVDVAVDVDTTLSISGAAADAKTVGDAIGDIDDILDVITGDVAATLDAINGEVI